MENNTNKIKKQISSLELANAKIAHEIKNPLAIIASTLQLIEIQQPNVKTNKHWHRLYTELDFISALLNDFNELNNAHTLDFKEMDLGELISEIYDRFESYALQSKVSMSLNLPDDLFNIRGDEIRLTEAFSNLIKNAIEAVKEDGLVTISLNAQNESVLVTIEDNGCGIEPDHLTTIFHPFISYKENGTGLGLPIVSSIIDEHHGVITIESTVGVGTKFTVTLPLTPLG